jgi:hypothetical protein
MPGKENIRMDFLVPYDARNISFIVFREIILSTIAIVPRFYYVLECDK